MAELWRGGVLESVHLGHAVICDAGGVVEAWGNPQAVIFPRSSCKMIQALPLLETGAAAARGLTDAHLALACASHQGAALHVGMAGAGWPTWAWPRPICAAARMNRWTATNATG